MICVTNRQYYLHIAWSLRMTCSASPLYCVGTLSETLIKLIEHLLSFIICRTPYDMPRFGWLMGPLEPSLSAGTVCSLIFSLSEQKGAKEKKSL